MTGCMEVCLHVKWMGTCVETTGAYWSLVYTFFRALHIKNTEGQEPLNMPLLGGHRTLLICESVCMAHSLYTQHLFLPLL